MVRPIFAMGLALAVLMPLAACSTSESLADDQAQMPASSKDFEGEQFRDVVDLLEDAGFTNVETNALGDLVTGWLNGEGEVEEVEIGGVASFEKGETLKRDAQILLSYHSFPEDEEEMESASPSTEPAKPDSSRETNWSGDQLEFRFGETAPFTSTAGPLPNTQLTFTVSEPSAFTPGDPADATQAATVYFTVTIQNLSDTETWQPDFVLSQAISGETDGDQIFQRDIIQSRPTEILPGQTISYTDGWSVANANDLTYELDIDGLAGYTIYFTR
jgi:hypothetical protein